jgi:hypothetical protein
MRRRWRAAKRAARASSRGAARRNQLAELLSSWKGTGKDRGETYLRRHWFRIRTTGGLTLSIYCERQSRNTKKPKARWWVYTVQK